MDEHVTGPWRGSFIATYACPVGEHGEAYIGYYRIYRSRPRNFSQPGSLVADSTSEAYSSPAAATRAALEEAKWIIASEPRYQALPRQWRGTTEMDGRASRY